MLDILSLLLASFLSVLPVLQISLAHSEDFLREARVCRRTACRAYHSSRESLDNIGQSCMHVKIVSETPYSLGVSQELKGKITSAQVEAFKAKQRGT